MFQNNKPDKATFMRGYQGMKILTQKYNKWGKKICFEGALLQALFLKNVGFKKKWQKFNIRLSTSSVEGHSSKVDSFLGVVVILEW